LSLEDIKQGMDVLKAAGVVELVLSGGNPLLREDIGEIIDYSAKRFVTTIYDNGSIAAKKFDLLRNVDFVSLSIDSLDEKKHDFIKNVSGAWQSAMHAVDVLKREGVKVSVAPMISQVNLYEIVDLTNYFTSKDIPVLYSLYSYNAAAAEEDEANQLFSIGKANDDFIITDKEAMVKLCDTLIEMRKKNRHILISEKLLKAIKTLYTEEKRTWNCRALQSFLVVNHVGKIAGCHNQPFVDSIFDLPKNWKNEKYNTKREQYKTCTKCTYLCYMFYSIYGTPRGYLSLFREQWKNASLLLKK
jgi:MoaA/NifB/PqqE/SkfB family radical SAM enzyme